MSNLYSSTTVTGGSAAQDAVLPVTATIARTVELTGLSRSEIYRLLGCEKINAVKSGRSTLVIMASVRAYLASLPAATIRAPKSFV